MLPCDTRCHPHSFPRRHCVAQSAAMHRPCRTKYWRRMVRACAFFFCAFTLFLPRPREALADNLLSNPNFDTDLSGWLGAGTPISWSTEDARDDTSSGSLRIKVKGQPIGFDV